MNYDIMKKWTETLRSDQYLQGRTRLNKEDEFCCLGVLCELAIEDGVQIKKTFKHGEFGVVTYDERSSDIPNAVIEWAQMKSSSGIYTTDIDTKHSLAVDNDMGANFHQIADIIEQKWNEL